MQIYKILLSVRISEKQAEVLDIGAKKFNEQFKTDLDRSKFVRKLIEEFEAKSKKEIA